MVSTDPPGSYHQIDRYGRGPDGPRLVLFNVRLSTSWTEYRSWKEQDFNTSYCGIRISKERGSVRLRYISVCRLTLYLIPEPGELGNCCIVRIFLHVF